MKKQYFVETPHTAEECMKALDEMSMRGADVLKMFRWGCKAGDHRGFAFVEAESEDMVKEMLPPSARDRAKAVEVMEFTPEQIRMMHEKM